ncbi:MAG TPA: phosphate ABC transporter ATP-binding protein [Planctomycetota bacterium]|nr:phosphate ABC transporter ATP-binding protein [Planctomycetota bacterium]
MAETPARPGGPRPPAGAADPSLPPPLPGTPAIEVRELNLWYGKFQALYEIDLEVQAGIVTALIGPSGCGKSTLLRSCNRINERLGYVTTTGSIKVLGEDIHGDGASRIQVSRHVGMVFQRPNPLPLSIRDNVLFGHRLHRETHTSRADEDDMVESALREVLLWDTVQDRLQARATELSLEQQQKLCIARLLPTRPTVLLMDEPCSALDAEATAAVEDLIWDLRGHYSILIVTHNMAQARRASDECVFMLMGRVIEHTETEAMFVSPRHQETADYIEGRFG